MNEQFPRFIAPFDAVPNESPNPFYVSAINSIMSHILPPYFFQQENALARFHEKLPIITWTQLGKPPFDLSFYLCCLFRPNAFRFVYEMVSRWLIPGRRMNALLQFAVDFLIPDFGHQMYIGGEVKIRIETEQELKILQQNLPVIETELRLGIESAYQANRILEIKGLSADEKTGLIQENITSLVKRRPQDFDFDILTDMQHFLVLFKEEFKAARCYKHMSRIICIHYLFQKALRFCYESFPDRRYISVKLLHEKLYGRQRVLGIIIGLSYLRENELFDERHIITAIQLLIPDAQAVKNSFFAYENRGEITRTYYLEVTKPKDDFFTLEQMRLLKRELPEVLKNRIEQRLNPIFMPTNEEEVMRGILTLSNQLKLVRDIPHVIISFNQQTEEALEFLVILLRVNKEGMLSIEKHFEAKPTYLEFLLERCKIVGILRKKYQKEATVFKLCIRKTPFLRQDHSLDLYKARQDVAAELTRVIGEYRDYNGGTISKESELMRNLRALLGKKAEENTFLLDNFFYSIIPPMMRSTLEPEPLKKLFLMILEAKQIGMEEAQPCLFQIQEDQKYFYMLIVAHNPSFKDSVIKAVEELGISSLQLSHCFVNTGALVCMGFIYRVNGSKDANRLRFAVEEEMTNWAENSSQALKY